MGKIKKHITYVVSTNQARLFVVGPESAGAHPGPACYRKGGPLTTTDANLFLGRLLPDSFPKIFGPDENEALDVDITRKKFLQLTNQINDETGQNKTPEEVALGFIEVANESMAKPIRLLTEARGYDTSAHQLACFGGAGGQHACAIASTLGIQKVIIHRYSSILSAYGMALADLVHEAQEPASGILDNTTLPGIRERVQAMKTKVSKSLLADGVKQQHIKHEVYLNIRYQGTDNTLMVLEPDSGDFLAAFHEEHKREFSFTFPDRKVLIEDIRVRGIGASSEQQSESPHEELRHTVLTRVNLRDASTTTRVTFASIGTAGTPVYRLEALKPGNLISGPAILIDDTQTLLVEPGASATILTRHVVLDVPPASKKLEAADVVDPIRLSVFGNRFMAIAEQVSPISQPPTWCMLTHAP